MRSPWWQGLDLRVLRHVRGVLRRRGLELLLVERRPDERAAFAPLVPDVPDGPELAAIDSMLGEAAVDVATALREREQPAEGARGRRNDFAGIVGGSPEMQQL